MFFAPRLPAERKPISFCHFTRPRCPQWKLMADANRIRALIADDEPLARQRIVDMLGTDDGVTVIGQVGDGDAAVEAIRSLQPDLVFLDVQMPGRTGLEVVREI